MHRFFSHTYILLTTVLLLSIYAFQSIKAVSASWHKPWNILFRSIFWGLVIFQILAIFSWNGVSERIRTYLFIYFFVLVIAELMICLFTLVDDIRRFLYWGYLKASSTSHQKAIGRSTFLSWLGVLISGSFLTTILVGLKNKYNYKIHRVALNAPNFPKAFKGLKVVQISDIHSGSFTNPAVVAHGVDMVLKENADLILFTGDLVNNRATEMKDYISIFSRLKAPMGVFSTLGNHDYGDYVAWPSAAAKKQNLEDLKTLQKNMGWRLLMNENVIFERNGEKLALLGIENWGAKGDFPKYGRLDLAYKGTENVPYKILMSHDPSHWDAQVRPKYPAIDLMLSGHTHGMQYGIEIPGFIKWSPIKWMYKEWAGLYTDGQQKLYVNRGYGFLGYPGRFGILPEITVFTFG